MFSKEFRLPVSSGVRIPEVSESFGNCPEKKWPEFPPVFDVPWDRGESEERNGGKQIGVSEKCGVVIRKIV
jgi:hypothetical protein